MSQTGTRYFKPFSTFLAPSTEDDILEKPHQNYEKIIAKNALEITKAVKWKIAEVCTEITSAYYFGTPIIK